MISMEGRVAVIYKEEEGDRIGTFIKFIEFLGAGNSFFV